MSKQPVTLLENSRDWPREIQKEINLIASLDGYDSSISVDDLSMVTRALCDGGTSVARIREIICDGNNNWTTDALWRAFSRLKLLKAAFSSTNKVHWHLDMEAKLVGEDKKREAYEILREVKRRYLERVSEMPGISAQEKVKFVYKILEEMGFIFQTQGAEESLFIDNLIDKRLDCDTSSFVVIALAEEFNWPVHLISVPNHSFVRWDDGKEVFNIDQGDILPDEYYKERFFVDGDLSRYKTPYDTAVYFNMGVTKLSKGDIDGAIAAFNKVLEINPRDAGAWNNLGYAKADKGNVDGAIAAYNKALEINPRDAEVWSNLGVAKEAKGDVDGAIAAYNKALEINPRLAEAWSNLGAAKKVKGDVDGAEKAFQEAKRLNPSF